MSARREDRRTRAVRAGVAQDSAFNAVIPPLYLSSTYAFEQLGVEPEYDYTRSANPTRDVLARALADLEGGLGGVITSSGMAAVAVVLHLLDPDDEVVVPHDCYGGTFRIFRSLAAKGHFRVSFVNQGDEGSLGEALSRQPRMVWIETPSNPLLRIVDIARVAEEAHAAGALVVVDNTFLSPALQQPLGLGADIVVHSTTKYINGHSDVVGGAVVCSEKALLEECAWWANCLGVTGSPFDSYLTMRGLRTLHARMAAHDRSAREVVSFVDGHPAVLRTYHPSLIDHPGHAVAARQQSGFGAMVSFEVVGGLVGVRALVEGLEHFTLAESLGGVESLVCHPSTMTHAAMDPEARAKAGIGDGLVRLSVGIEHPDDLIDDLSRGLDSALAAVTRANGLGRGTAARALNCGV